MKLQIKDSGAWRNVATFTTRDELLVRAAASLLLRALNQPNTVLRIAEDDMPLDFCEAPSCTWRSEAVGLTPPLPTQQPAGAAAMSAAQVKEAYFAAAYDIDIEPTDEEILDLVCTTFGMSRTQAIRRIDQFNYVEVASSTPVQISTLPHREASKEASYD